MPKSIYVTQPYMPELEEFTPFLEKIWESKILTNNGPFHQQLEQALCEYLGVNHISLFTNGTIALLTALQTLHITGEVITTPYSFVATSHSLLWNNIKPVFVDIDPVTCNINPKRIEEAITPQTAAILAVHCYGNPCAVEQIEEIAETHGLKVIYDAAHAFGVRYKGLSLLSHGNMSVLSFHATKIYNTFEGGAIICPDAETKKRIDYNKNFGFLNETTVNVPGINGKMSEINAAFGLLQLKHVDYAINRRREIDEYYRDALSDVRGISLLEQPRETEGNASYFPVFINDDSPVSRDVFYYKLKDVGIHGRRYFYPLLSDMPMYKDFPSAENGNLVNARKAADQVVCLPIYPDLQIEQLDRIIQEIRKIM